MSSSTHTKFWLEFRVISDGLELPAVEAMRAATPTPPSFAPFPCLPPELRLKIWGYLIAPRVVAVACLDSETAPWRRADLLAPRPPARDPSPVLLRVCREARELALAHYELAFAWKVPHVLAGMDLLVPPGPGAGTSSAAAPAPPAWSAPRVWFNFALDALYLLGELEPCDSYGFNSPMAYFLSRHEARRVRRAAVAFGALRYGEAGAQQIFGSLFHVVDRFPPADGRVLVAVTPEDEDTHVLMGGEGPLVPSEDGDEDAEGWGGIGSSSGGSGSGSGGGSGTGSYKSGAIARIQGRARQRRPAGQEEGNFLQEIWRNWYRGSIVKSSLANIEFVLVREADLAKHILDSVASVGSESKRDSGGNGSR